MSIEANAQTHVCPVVVLAYILTRVHGEGGHATEVVGTSVECLQPNLSLLQPSLLKKIRWLLVANGSPG